MTLAVGTMLGPYEILSPLGAGGMGEVYRARDTRLERTVAVKVVSRGLDASEHLRARFELEARAISALSHPNICTLYDVGNENGAEYLVMEHLEGESLAERLSRGPLPSSLALRYGAQIAEALQHAHRAGITHRDLKPGNIMITSAGAKLLDFGLAKLVESSPRVASSQTATLVAPLTAEGTIVGTTNYMSPEQIQGKPIDHRTDIFSLGVVLYEMVTGQRPFRGDSPASLVAAVISSDPVPIRSLQPAASPALERLIQTALEKEPDDRWQTAQDVGRQLRWISESSLSAEASPPPRQHRFRLAMAVGVTTIVASLLTWGVGRFLSPSAERGARVSLQFALPPELLPTHSPEVNDFAISPDGRTVAVVASRGATSQLFLRDLDSFGVRDLKGSDGASSPFWSSDGKWLGFSARGKLWKMRISGDTPPEPICDLPPHGARATWMGKTILFADVRGDRLEIYRVEDTGGTPVAVTSPKAREWRHSWPQFLPDGQHFLYESFSSGSLERTLFLASLSSPDRSVIARNTSHARLVGKDRIAYVRDGVLLAQRFDLSRGVIEEPTTIASDVAYFYMTGRADFDTCSNGGVVYRTDTQTGRLVLMDRKGQVTRIIDDGLFFDCVLSPDGKIAAVTVETRSTGLMDIWLYDLTRGIRDRFTSEPAIEASPTWSPDGKSIVYSQGEGGVFPHLVRRSLTGSISEELTPKGPFQFSPSFTPDGKSLYFQNDSGSGNSILRLTIGSNTIEPFIDTEFSEAEPTVSPDGRWLAYSSNATGRSEIYIQSLMPGDSIRIRISNRGGYAPRWRADAKELFFVSAERDVTSAVPGQDGDWNEAFLETLFHVPSKMSGFSSLPDGESFLIAYWDRGAGDEFFHVVLGLE